MLSKFFNFIQDIWHNEVQPVKNTSFKNKSKNYLIFIIAIKKK